MRVVLASVFAASLLASSALAETQVSTSATGVARPSGQIGLRAAMVARKPIAASMNLAEDTDAGGGSGIAGDAVAAMAVIAATVGTYEAVHNRHDHNDGISN